MRVNREGEEELFFIRGEFTAWVDVCKYSGECCWRGGSWEWIEISRAGKVLVWGTIKLGD